MGRFRAFSLAALLSLPLSLACTGYITGDESGAPAGGGGDGTGGPGVGPDGKPFKGPIVSNPAPSSRFVRLNHRQWENTVRDLLRLGESTGLSNAFVAEPLR